MYRFFQQNRLDKRVPEVEAVLNIYKFMGFEIRRFCGRPVVIKCPRVVDVVFSSLNSDSAYPIIPDSM